MSAVCYNFMNAKFLESWSERHRNNRIQEFRDSDLRHSRTVSENVARALVCNNQLTVRFSVPPCFSHTARGGNNWFLPSRKLGTAIVRRINKFHILSRLCIVEQVINIRNVPHGESFISISVKNHRVPKRLIRYLLSRVSECMNICMAETEDCFLLVFVTCRKTRIHVVFQHTIILYLFHAEVSLPIPVAERYKAWTGFAR
jgi:hypothetical protein